MTTEEATRRIREIIGDCAVSFSPPTTFTVAPPGRRMYEEWVVSFDKLKALSEAFGTTLIDLEYDAGWGGTDVTPGDPATVQVRVRLPMALADM